MIDGYADDYIFALQRPGDAEFYAVFEQTALADMNVIAEKIRAYQQSPVSFDKENKTINALYQEYAGYVYPSAHNIDEYKKRVKTNAVFAEIERLYNEASQTQMTRNEQFAAAAEGERRKREAAAESARKAKEWQESNHNLFVLDVFIPFGAGTVGIGEEMGLYFSPVRYITLGGSGFLFAASNLETLCGGGLFSAGLVLPLSSSENRMEVFADGFLSAASLPHPGLISKQVSPGFTGGIRYVSTWIGFEIKYRGFRLANDYHLHAISGGMVVLW
jgi:hypothetical protein